MGRRRKPSLTEGAPANTGAPLPSDPPNADSPADPAPAQHEARMQPEQQTDTAKGRPTSKLVWTVNNEDRLYHEAYSPGASKTLEPENFGKRPRPLDVVIVTWAPGINAHLDSELELCGFKPDRHGYRETVDPTMLSIPRAQTLIKRSKSRKALKRWREIEKRPPVLAAIDAALAGDPKAA